MEYNKITLEAIDSAIQAMCQEVEDVKPQYEQWQCLEEGDLFYELVVCVASSQTIFETSVAVADQIKAQGLLDCVQGRASLANYEALLQRILEEPVEVIINGKSRQVRYRFRNRLASLLSATVHEIYGRGTSIKGILNIAHSPRHARELLVNVVSGFGPKQASLFLRRIGYCSDLAVLDTHVLDYLELAASVEPKPNMLARIAGYERIENEFLKIAERFGHAIGCVDLALWITMRVAKREFA